MNNAPACLESAPESEEAAVVGMLTVYLKRHIRVEPGRPISAGHILREAARLHAIHHGRHATMAAVKEALR